MNLNSFEKFQLKHIHAGKDFKTPAFLGGGGLVHPLMWTFSGAAHPCPPTGAPTSGTWGLTVSPAAPSTSGQRSPYEARAAAPPAELCLAQCLLHGTGSQKDALLCPRRFSRPNPSMSSNNWAPDGAQIPPQSFPVLLEMEGPRAPRAPLRPAAAGASPA